MNYEHEHEWEVNGTKIRAVRGSVVVSEPATRGMHTEIVKTYRDSLGISAQAQAVAEAQRLTIKLATEYAFLLFLFLCFVSSGNV